ncbi:copper-binding protein [Zobellella endophytica]|uniref:Copper-binding protein n=1 Tax=Zobellella endophytica TaxID=2116700 RepID=A0A2P7R8C1_9GAMM|nr:copper-binding protein [Zobellella endophytica]PSJ46440.1 copper-binding protein [Zobellella endophytica]
MKQSLTGSLTLVMALSATPALAEQKMMEGMPIQEMKNTPMQMPASGQAVHTARGKVTKVDAATGVVTLTHGPVESLGWPGMTMGFRVMDQALLDRLAVGSTVEFEFRQGEKGYVITGVK